MDARNSFETLMSLKQHASKFQNTIIFIKFSELAVTKELWRYILRFCIMSSRN